MLSTLPQSGSHPFANIRLSIRSLQPQLVQWRRDIHRYPELGFEEQRTAKKIQQILTQLGIEHQTGIAKTGIMATIDSGQPGPVLAIRADMDALPVQEENEVDYKSCYPGKMHACGHDGHTAIALGTAKYLADHLDSFRGTVKIFFQPAEEGPGGAQPMIDAGVLESPQVDAIIGLHLWNDLPLGSIGIKPGPVMAAVERFTCELQGKGGHGAMPHQTIDAVVLSAHVVNASQQVVSRNLDPLQSAVVTIGELKAGSTFNVIADSARLRGTVRYFDPSLAGYFSARLEQIVQGLCQSFQADYHWHYEAIYPPVVNDPNLVELVQAAATEVLTQPHALNTSYQTLAGEDMSFFLQAVPGCYFLLGAANSALGLDYPHHHPHFDFDESVLAVGVELFVNCVERFTQAL